MSIRNLSTYDIGRQSVYLASESSTATELHAPAEHTGVAQRWCAAMTAQSGAALFAFAEALCWEHGAKEGSLFASLPPHPTSAGLGMA